MECTVSRLMYSIFAAATRLLGGCILPPSTNAAPLRTPLAIDKLQARETHGVVDDQEDLGIQRRVRAQPRHA